MKQILVGRAVVFCVSLVVLACSEEGDKLQPRTPAGLRLVVSPARLAPGLAQMQLRENTPIARASHEALKRLRDCPHAVVRVAPGKVSSLDRILDGLECAAAGDGDPPLLSQEAARWTLREAEAREWTQGTIRVSPSAEVVVTIRVPALTGVAGLFAADKASPGLGVLAEPSLLHARLKVAGGIELAALVPEGSQADDLFQLKGTLFGRTVLDGTWEVGLYPARYGDPVPPVTVAIGVRSRSAAVQAMEAFISSLEKRWPVHRSPYVIDGARGACLKDLKILPYFSPCYVATDKALILGWNEVSIEAGLGRRSALSMRQDSVLSPDVPKKVQKLSAPAHGGLLLVNFLDFPATDDAVYRTFRRGAIPPELVLVYPWSRLRGEAKAVSAGTEFVFTLELEGVRSKLNATRGTNSKADGLR